MVSIVGPNLALFLLIIQLRTVISDSTSEGALEQRLLDILNNFKPCHGGRHHDSTSEESGSSEEADCKCKLRHHRHHKPCQDQAAEKPKTSCSAEWKYLNTTESCYFVGNNTVNATDAQKICRDHGGDLASIHSDAENDFIKTCINSTLSGGGGSTGYVWIGQFRTGPTETEFRNFDGTPMDYIKFRAGAPDNHQGQQYCNSMETFKGDWYGLWDDHYCSASLEYVCKKPANKL